MRNKSFNTRFLGISVAAMIILAAPAMGCKNKNGKTGGAPINAGTEHPSRAADTADKTPARSEAEPTRDVGEPCVGHEYLVSPGGKEKLLFNMKLPAAADPSSLNFRLVRNDAAEAGGQARLGNVNYEPYWSPIWIMDAGKVFGLLDEPPRIYSISNEMGEVSGRVEFNERGVGPVELLVGGELSAERAGALSEEEVREKIEDDFLFDTSRDLSDPSAVDGLEVKFEKGTGEGFIGYFEVDLETPAELSDLEEGEERIMIFAADKAIELKIFIRRAVSGSQFSVLGPDYRSDCEER